MGWTGSTPAISPALWKMSVTMSKGGRWQRSSPSKRRKEQLYPAWTLQQWYDTQFPFLSCSFGSSSPHYTQTLNSRLQISEATINTGALPLRHKDHSLRRNALNVLTVGSNAFQSSANLESGRLDEDQCAPF